MERGAAETFEAYLRLSGRKAWEELARHAFSESGYKGMLRWEVNAMERRRHAGYVSPSILAELYARLGDREKALGFLEESYRQRAPEILWMQNDPAYDFLHRDERYRSLVRQIGLPPAY
jgi:uncharacterized protein HemY